MDNEIFDNNDVLRLIRAIQQYSNQSIFKWTKLTKHNLGISPILVLSELSQKGPQKQTDLAHTLGYTPGAITNIANKLIDQDLATRLYDEADRRTVIMKITVKGEHVLKDSQDKGHEVHAKVFEGLSDAELKQFLTTYEKLLKNIE